MKLSKNSWHYRFYGYMQDAPARPTVCGYWSTIFIALPLAAVMACIMLPFVWLGGKIDEKLKGKTLCPFGRVDFDE